MTKPDCVLARASSFLVIVLAFAAVTGPAAARRLHAAVVQTCASDRLPTEILDGRAPTPRSPLSLVDATGPRGPLRLAVADDGLSREAGLMCVLRLRPQHGMVFVFSRDSVWEFWMKNTIVPLDMVWIRADGTVSTVAASVPAVTRVTPDTSVPRRRGRGTYVVELTAGEAARDGLVAGAHVTLPPLRTDR